jgi:acyl dehydratase
MSEFDVDPQLPTGTYEEALTWVGRERTVQFAPMPVNETRIKLFASMIRDPNPAYWDPEPVAPVWIGRPAPPGMLITWMIPMGWRPCGAKKVLPMCTEAPLPGDSLINVENETRFHRPVFVGDHINVVDRVVSVSEEKRTRLGPGHFVETVATYRNQAGHLLATETLRLLRFNTAAGA